VLQRNEWRTSMMNDEFLSTLLDIWQYEDGCLYVYQPLTTLIGLGNGYWLRVSGRMLFG